MGSLLHWLAAFCWGALACDAFGIKVVYFAAAAGVAWWCWDEFRMWRAKQRPTV